MPRSRGGGSDLSNLCLACQGCNSRKYTSIDAVDPVNGELVALFHPRKQRWEEHFAWSHDFAVVIGLTSTARATVARLQLNRRGVVRLRRVLRSIGAHPPLD